MRKFPPPAPVEVVPKSSTRNVSRKKGPRHPSIKGLTVEERFWSKVKEAPNGCWLWTGGVARGHGSFAYVNTPKQIHRYAHRVAYEFVVGLIPKGYDIDHLCDEPLCVNPAHLEPCTHGENVRRAAARRTHCRKGHPYNEANTQIHGGVRICRTCRMYSRRARAAKKGWRGDKAS